MNRRNAFEPRVVNPFVSVAHRRAYPVAKRHSLQYRAEKLRRRIAASPPSRRRARGPNPPPALSRNGRSGRSYRQGSFRGEGPQSPAVAHEAARAAAAAARGPRRLKSGGVGADFGRDGGTSSTAGVPYSADGGTPRVATLAIPGRQRQRHTQARRQAVAQQARSLAWRCARRRPSPPPRGVRSSRPSRDSGSAPSGALGPAPPRQHRPRPPRREAPLLRVVCAASAANAAIVASRRR